MSRSEPKSRSREVAYWAGLSAFFGNLIGLKVLDLLSSQDVIKIGAAVIASCIAGAAVYSKERLDAAKARRNGQ